MQNDLSGKTIRQDQPESYPEGPPTEKMEKGATIPPTVSLEKGREGLGPSPASPLKTEVLGVPPPTFAWLIVKEGPRAGRLYRLNPEVTSIGRDSQNDIIIDDTAVSSQHAKVKVEKGEGNKGRFFIHDLATRNGTVVNGQQILKHALEDNDEIQIGRTVLVFKMIADD